MVVHKQRVDICNKTLMNSVHWGPKTGTYALKTLNMTGPQLLGQAGFAFVDAYFDLREGDVGAGDGEGEGGDVERMNG